MTIRTPMLAAVLSACLITPSFAQQQTDQQSTPSQTQGSHGIGVHAERHRSTDLSPFAMMRGQRLEHLERLITALAQGTFFRIKHGDDEVIVHCPQGANLQDCVTAATDLMKAVPEMGAESSNETDEQNQNQQQ